MGEAGLMRRLTAVTLTAAAALGLAACGTAPEPDPAAKPSATAATLSPDAKASARSAAGLPPEPDAATRTAYIAALNAIDSDVVHGKDDKAVSRGLNQCTSIKSKSNDRPKLISLTNSRFTSPDHPDGHGLAKAEKILDVVHKNLCPDF
jgi:hypothetical protein